MFRGGWRHRFLFGRGMLSDDTEHALFVAQSLLAHPEDAERFAGRLAWCLRFWFLGLPAGIGLATLRAILKLWVWFPPRKSGVFSAGNGPAMRVAPIGARFWQKPDRMADYVQASTLLTHRDPKAVTGALAVARVTAWCMGEESLAQRPQQRPALSLFVSMLRECDAADPGWSKCVDAIEAAAEEDETVAQLAARLGLERGVTGYIYHTVPVALYGWYRHFGSFEESLTAVLDRGGDTDTAGAIVGALAGASVGAEAIPDAWRSGIADWPRTLKVLERVADRLAAATEGQGQQGPVRYFWPGIALRNPLFLLVVLGHGFRRLAPPY